MDRNYQIDENEIKDYLNHLGGLLKDNRNKFELYPLEPMLSEGDNKLSSIKNIKEMGIYMFLDGAERVVYIGQGGGETKTHLCDRIGQELRLYKKGEKGNNGCTLSKNIQKKEKIFFKEKTVFIKYIKDWHIAILSFDKESIPLNLTEHFLIYMFNPKYNIDKHEKEAAGA